MDFPQSDLPAKAPRSLPGPRHPLGNPSRASQASPDPLPFMLVLLAELGACVHLIASDLARARNLEAARAGWIERLMAIIAMIEGGATRSERQRRASRRGNVLRAAPVALPISDTDDDADDDDLDASMLLQSGAPTKHSRRSTVSTVSAVPTVSVSSMLTVPERPRLSARSARSTRPAPSERIGLGEQSNRASAPITAIQSQRVPALASPSAALRLTAREREIMKLARRGLPPRAIARRLQLSVQTVYTHLRNIRRKQR